MRNSLWRSLVVLSVSAWFYACPPPPPGVEDGGASGGGSGEVGGGSSAGGGTASGGGSVSGGGATSGGGSSSGGGDTGGGASTGGGSSTGGGPAGGGSSMGGGSSSGGGSADAGPDSGVPDAGRDAGVDAGPRGLPWVDGPVGIDGGWVAAPPACDGTDWAKKYFTYRKRFVGDGTAANPGFKTVGYATGDSMPATSRIPNADCASDWRVSGCSMASPPITNGKGLYTYGDTTIWVGWDLLNLATEFAAFNRMGISTATTLHDLHASLVSLNRLDTAAEQTLGYAAALDGFFLRTDVPTNYVYANSTSGAPRWPRNDGFSAYQCIGAGPACPPQTVADGDFTSQDQVIGVLLGASFVLKYVPQGTIVNGMDLNLEMKGIVHRMVNHLRTHSWRVTGPNGQHPPDAWGGDARAYSHEFALAANHLVGTYFGVSDYGVDETGTNIVSTTYGTTALSGTDLSWSTQTDTNKSLAIKFAIINNDWDQAKVASRALSLGDPMFAVIHSLLWNQPLDPSISSWEFESQLTKAPCTGPCTDTPNCAMAQGWMGANRIKDPEARSGSTGGANGEFNGMDYLTTHNAYFLLRNGHYTEVPLPIPSTCTRAGQDPGDFIGQSTPTGTSYDPRATCSEMQMAKSYCGRPFAGWLAAAYRGEVTIFTGGTRWSCTDITKPCQLIASSSTGTSGTDLFIGTTGSDTFDAADGNDCLYGMGGDDHLKGGLGRDELWGGDGADELCGEGCGLVEVNGDNDVIFGEAGNDTLNGGPGSDELFGGNDDDTIDGHAGDDFIFGETGNDTSHGGDGDDIIRGGIGNDALYGENGADRILGEDGRDKLSGGAGNDNLAGGTGNDFLMGDADDDTLWGEDGDDRLCGGCGGDWLNGGWSSNDACRGSAISILCINEASNTIDPGSCGSASLSNSQCDDPAFQAW